MAKGDDVRAKKKMKAQRKKLNASSSSVSARVASIIAAKKRRLSGKRSMCQGMCFGLPTLEDPFCDRNGKAEFKDAKKINKRESSKEKKGLVNKDTINRENGEINNTKQKSKKPVNLRTQMKSSVTSSGVLGQNEATDLENKKVHLNRKGCNQKKQASEYSDCPSKFFVLCLNAIEKSLRQDITYSNDEKPLFVNPWGVEFLKFFSMGKDILETSGTCTFEQVAWIISIAADAIARKEKEGLSFSSPFLLFLVPSQEKAAKVRLVCKPLKDLGVHTVSLHPGASLDHQIRGLKSCEPEFLVSTPERLMELVSLKAIDISRVSFLVVDGLDSLHQDGFFDALKSIRQSIWGNPRTIVFNNNFNYASVPSVQNLFVGSISRLSLNDSICSQSACILQTVKVCSSEEEKLSKGMQVLNGAYDDQLSSQYLKVLFIVENENKSKLIKVLKSNNYSDVTDANSDISDINTSIDSSCEMKPAVSVINEEHISTADLSVFEIVILADFVHSTESYVQILTKMARNTVHGVLHSFITEEDALLAEPLIEILEQCEQEVPEALRTLHDRSSMSE
ncbi:ATP-dependent RNA helicase DBP3 [Mercurialis annua]|uniref:ATP-dependent RNA helicase DBP3 n=1 Tax=Mercurialis annua TaxID=3986 RepID=UPI0021602F31|nr:ATP-dependent RNA helicase DBP3 [Mercurialis annua]